ncbi:MAG: DUF4389 domain-containing protein [Methylococcales bacterium]|jgi:hypothetical protein|nr:DUF4389 domain-containing protein [Methylococcaceae bacterium]
MDQEINDNLKKISTWKRIFFMLVFSVIVGLVRVLLWAVILLQVASALMTGAANKNILGLGGKLSAYLYHILLFLTYNTDKLPFPFSAWNLIDEVKLPEIQE